MHKGPDSEQSGVALIRLPSRAGVKFWVGRDLALTFGASVRFATVAGYNKRRGRVRFGIRLVREETKKFPTKVCGAPPSVFVTMMDVAGTEIKHLPKRSV